MGFTPSRPNTDIWIKRNNDGIYDFEIYYFIATHGDDLIIASKNPEEYVSLINHEFALRHIKTNPPYKKENIPTQVNTKPEMDDTEFL